MRVAVPAGFRKLSHPAFLIETSQLRIAYIPTAMAEETSTQGRVPLILSIIHNWRVSQVPNNSTTIAPSAARALVELFIRSIFIEITESITPPIVKSCV